MNINQILAAAPAGLSRGGAPMGKRDQFDTDCPRLYVQRLRMVDGAYDASGVYWGAPSPQHGMMFCGFNSSARVYVRAKSRADALAQIRAGYPSATFFRG